jgi:rod shape-determining protein MreC
MAQRRTDKVTILGAVLPLRFLLQRLTLFFMVALAVSIIFLSRSDNPQVVKARTQVMDAVVPVVYAVSKPVEFVVYLKDSVHNIIFVYQENRTLKQQNARLLHIQNLAAQLQTENQRLRNMVNFVPEPSLEFVSARVVTDTSGPFVRAALVNAGTENGVDKGYVAVNEKGLVGRVVDVGATSARVLLLTDINSRVPVVTSKSKERGILMGNNEALPQMTHHRAENEIKVGETIVTSGDGQFFPSGMPVGIVKEVKEGHVLIEPFVRSSQLQYVNIADYKKNHKLR